MKRGALGFGLVMLAVWVSWPGEARAAFVVTNGLDRKVLRRHQVSVAVVRVRSVRVNQTRKRQGFVLHRWVDLRVVKLLHGTMPTGKGLRNVPYSPMVNSAWPYVQGTLRGRYFIMAWIRGYPCGLGMTVSLGPRVRLPVVARGPRDPRVDAVKRLLKVVYTTPRQRLVSALQKMFRKGTAVESRVADGALLQLHGRHRNAYARYRRLTQLLQSGAKADPWLGWSVQYDLSKFPAIRTASDFRRWRRQTTARRVHRDFVAFRAAERKRLTSLARTAKNNPDLRVLAVWQLTRAPSYVGRGRNVGDRKTLAVLRALRTDPLHKIRQAARLALSSVIRQRRSPSRRP